MGQLHPEHSVFRKLCCVQQYIQDVASVLQDAQVDGFTATMRMRVDFLTSRMSGGNNGVLKIIADGVQGSLLPKTLHIFVITNISVEVFISLLLNMNVIPK